MYEELVYVGVGFSCISIFPQLWQVATARRRTKANWCVTSARTFWPHRRLLKPSFSFIRTGTMSG